MARIGTPRVDSAGVYAALRHHFEADLRLWEANGSRTNRQGVPFPRQRILDGLRAGETVNVPFGALPSAVRFAAPTRKGRLGLATIYPPRAIVTPLDRISWSDDDAGRLWLEENGEVDVTDYRDL
ncbi:hypothetical protein [Mycobacterium sp. E1319]|uniref:hypothetical protein n=2 Tax=unclassified Mycobacterium TaxID=2642494 RepID=UPI000A62D41B|nr:hypothetical protein [Mycobacterium sp. E1319]